ncbi:MAG: CBS domain-containing protein [bacterium]|nr:CBS domain-containing protein [bacterium]
METAGDILKEKGSEMICVGEDTTIFEALKMMIANKIGAILVKREDKIVGIWTERDLVRNTVTEGFDVETARVGDYMTTGLRHAPAGDSVYRLLDKFLGMRLRHLLIEKDEEYIGMLTPGDVIKAILHLKTEALQKENAAHSWDYYEDWQWRKRFKKVETPGQPVREL